MGHNHHKGSAEPDNAAVSVSSPPLNQAIDPVCGMSVQPSSAKTAAYHNTIYYFCSQKCREKFEAEPQSYAEPLAVTASEKEHHHGCC